MSTKNFNSGLTTPYLRKTNGNYNNRSNEKTDKNIMHNSRDSIEEEKYSKNETLKKYNKNFIIAEDNLDFINSNSLFAALHSDRYNKDSEDKKDQYTEPYKLEFLKQLIINPKLTKNKNLLNSMKNEYESQSFGINNNGSNNNYNNNDGNDDDDEQRIKDERKKIAANIVSDDAPEFAVKRKTGKIYIYIYY